MMKNPESSEMVGFDDALSMCVDSVRKLDSEDVSIFDVCGRIVSEDVFARISCPSVSSSHKDGYAIRSRDLAGAGSEQSTTRLLVLPATAAKAGMSVDSLLPVPAGGAIAITSGAPLPPEADVVVPYELADNETKNVAGKTTSFSVSCSKKDLERHVMPKGCDVYENELLVTLGDVVTPSMVGRLAAGGALSVRCYKRPRIAVIATGNEVLLPIHNAEDPRTEEQRSRGVRPGQLFASNALSLRAWLVSLGMQAVVDHALDKEESLRKVIGRHMDDSTIDAVITCGGVWGSSGDLVVSTLESLGLLRRFHRVKLGPGKAIAFHQRGSDFKPVFSLPGGPFSNEAAFLLLALPGLFSMNSHMLKYMRVRAVLDPAGDAVTRRGKQWTQLVHGYLHTAVNAQRLYIGVQESMEGQATVVKVTPGGLTQRGSDVGSRLRVMSDKEGFIVIPPDRETYNPGEVVEFVLLPRWP